MKFLLVLAFAAAAVAVPHGRVTTIKDLFQGKHNERIISGTPASPGQFPWQVAINSYSTWGSSVCGGSLISEEWVLTAAHCAQGAVRFRLQFGAVTLHGPEDGRVIINTTEYIVHPDYNKWFNNDIALIKLPEPIIFTDTIKPIRLPYRSEKVSTGDELIASGWGMTSDQSSVISNILNFVQLSAITNSECTRFYGSSTIISSTLCCRGDPEHSTCRGDRGGPLVSYDWFGQAYHLVGVISFVHRSGCATRYPSGYVRTQSFLDWIHENTGIPILD